MAGGRGSHARRERYPMPDDVRQELTGRGLDAAYAERPPYQQNDYLGWIGRAKRRKHERGASHRCSTSLQAGSAT